MLLHLLSAIAALATHEPSWGVSYGKNADPYEETRAKLFMWMSAAAYCDEDQIISWTCKPCLQADTSVKAKIIKSADNSSLAFVGHSVGETTDNIVVSFRGTDDLSNWIANLDFPKTSAYPECDGCEVHGGFYSAWLSVKDGVVAEVKNLLTTYPDAQIFVTGHSLGAALAALCTAELGASSTIDPKITAVYTYGQPRIGNEKFREFYDSGTSISWRLTHQRDPIPHLPPLHLGFIQTSTEVFYNEDFSTHKICDSSGEDQACSDQFTFETNIEDHLVYLSERISRSC